MGFKQGQLLIQGKCCKLIGMTSTLNPFSKDL